MKRTAPFFAFLMTLSGTLLIVSLAGSMACTPTVYIHTDAPDQRLTMRDAGRKLGVRVKQTDKPEGAITVEFKDADAGVCGVALEKIVGAESAREALTEGVIDCQPKAWSCSSADALAHEIGHVVARLPHKAGTGMAARVSSEPFTDKQKTIVRVAAVAFAELCPRHPDATVTDPMDTPID